jgi:hypothetical protein
MFSIGFRRPPRYGVMMPKTIFRSLLLIGFIIISVGGVRISYRNTTQAIALRPLSFDPDNPKINQIGQLQFEKAWELLSDNPDFGGISGLTTLPDGRFIGLSDAGTLIGFGLTDNLRADHPFIAPLPEAYGVNKTFEDRDSESIASDPATGTFWVSYEHRNMIRRFTPSFSRSDGMVQPAEMRAWPGNSGAEALVRMADGRFIAFSEGATQTDGSYQAILFSGDPVEAGTTTFTFCYRPPSGYKATDAKMLPDGQMLILNRRFGFPNGFSAILSVLDPGQISKDATVSGTPIAVLKSPLLVDNMEGLAITQEGERVIIWLVSDNNFNIWQRTLLMKFALILAKEKPAASPAPGFDSL